MNSNSQGSVKKCPEKSCHISDIVAVLTNKGLTNNLSGALQLFSNMVVASSFLSIALCLYDHIADLFGFKKDVSVRIKTARIAFLPPTLLGVLLPDGFIKAIGFATPAMIIFCILTPVIMARIGRRQDRNGFRVAGGTPRMVLVMIFGTLILFLAMLEMVRLVPKFG